MADKIRYVGNAVRKEKNIKNLKRSLSLTLALLVIIIAALAGLKIAQKTAAGEETSKAQTGSFPVSFSTNDIRDVRVMDKTLVVLTKKFVTALNSSGKILWENPISFGDPAVTVSRNYTVVFDRLSNKYAIIDKNGKITDRKSDISGQIFNIRVTDSGHVLLALKSDNSSSLVCLQDKKGENKLIWSCTQEYVTDLALSPDLKTVFCSGIGASGGELYTKVYALTVKNGHEKSYTLPFASGININAVSSDRFNLLTTEGLYFFDSSKDEIALINSHETKSKLIHWSMDSKGNIAVVTDSTGDISENTLTVYNSKAEEKYSLSLDDSVEDIFVSEDEALVLYSDSVLSVKKGEVHRELFFENKAVGVIKAARQIYCYSLGGVEKATD